MTRPIYVTKIDEHLLELARVAAAGLGIKFSRFVEIAIQQAVAGDAVRRVVEQMEKQDP